jgi:hypothetical protein
LIGAAWSSLWSCILGHAGAGVCIVWLGGVIWHFLNLLC